MNKVLKAGKRNWLELASQELADLLVYVQNLPENRAAGRAFRLPTGTGGRPLLESKGCTGCHNGYSTLERHLADRTITDLAAAMWNHASLMRAKAGELTQDDIREIMAYIWMTDFLSSRGNVSEGRKVFDARCGTCHGDPGVRAPDLKNINRSYTAITMVWALWSHGPAMLEEVARQNGSGRLFQRRKWKTSSRSWISG